MLCCHHVVIRAPSIPSPASPRLYIASISPLYRLYIAPIPPLCRLYIAPIPPLDCLYIASISPLYRLYTAFVDGVFDASVIGLFRADFFLGERF